MKAIRYFIFSAILIALGVGMASDASAQRDPRDKRRGDSTDVRKDTIRKRDLDLRDRPAHRGRIHHVIGFFATNDSCREILLAQMSTEDAATLTRLYAALKGGNEQLQTLRAELRAARVAGDTAAFRRISEQLKTLYRQQGSFHKMIAELFNKYDEVAMRIRKECGGRPPKDRDGERGDRSGGVISPNPVTVGGTAVLTLNLTAESMVGVTISNDAGTVLTIPAATLPAGEQQIALDVSTLTRGVYLVQVQIGDKTQVLKLMVR